MLSALQAKRSKAQCPGKVRRTFPGVRNRIHLTPATVIASLALVFAMTGGAYAASKVLITSTKQISPKVLKSLKGANGKNGVAGLAGPAGAPGPGGPQGPAGPGGAVGGPGAPGKEGPPGTNGKEGSEGSPWTAGGTLPSGATETGVWGGITNAEKDAFSTISFPIPLKKALANVGAVFVTVKEVEESKIPAGCSGSEEAPKAASGHLCVFEGGEGGTVLENGVNIFMPGKVPGAAGVATTGDLLIVVTKEVGIPVYGTWAITAE